MAKYYIDSNASGAGTGADWINAYADLDDYIADTPSDDDVLWYAHNHSENHTTANKSFVLPDNVQHMSVNSGTDAYQKGASIKTTGIYDITFVSTGDSKRFFFYGMIIESGDDIFFNEQASRFYFNDCTLKLAGVSADRILATTDGAYVELIDCLINFSAASQLIQVGGGSRLKIINADFTGTTLLTSNFITASGNGGTTIEISNTDLSAILSTGGIDLIGGSGVTVDSVNAHLNRCKIHSGQVWLPSQPLCPNVYIDAISCDSGNGYYHSEYERFEGKVITNTTVTRTGGATYDGSTGFCYEFQPNSAVETYSDPLRIKLTEIEVDLSSAKDISVYIAMEDSGTITPTNVTDDLYWIEIEQNDATNKALGITISSRSPDPVATPSALTASSEIWSGRGAGNKDEFEITETTTAVTGMTNGQVTIYFCCAEYISTRQIYVCPSPDVAAV